MRLEDIEIAVQIEIADAHSHTRLHHAVRAQGHAAAQAFLTKCAVAVIAEKEAGRGIAGDKNVRPAIVVEIGGDAPSWRSCPWRARSRMPR